MFPPTSDDTARDAVPRGTANAAEKNEVSVFYFLLSVTVMSCREKNLVKVMHHILHLS